MIGVNSQIASSVAPVERRRLRGPRRHRQGGRAAADRGRRGRARLPRRRLRRWTRRRGAVVGRRSRRAGPRPTRSCGRATASRPSTGARSRSRPTSRARSTGPQAGRSRRVDGRARRRAAYDRRGTRHPPRPVSAGMSAEPAPNPTRESDTNVSTEDVRLRALEGREETPAREAHAALETALFEVKRVIVGQEGMLERLLVALLAGGHVLLEGVPGPRQDAHDQDRRRRARRLVQAAPVHARPRAGRPRRHAHLPRRHGRVRHRARAGVLQLPARRRDQPRAGEGAVGAARGDAGAPGHDRPRDASGAGAVPRDGDAEPDRVRGHLPAARGAGRPLHVQARRRLPDRARRGRSSSSARSRAAARRARCCRPRCSGATSRRRARSTSTGA